MLWGSFLQNVALLQSEMRKLLHFGRLLQNAALHLISNIFYVLLTLHWVFTAQQQKFAILFVL